MPAHRLTDDLTWPEIINKICRESNKDTPKYRKWLNDKSELGHLFFNSIMYSRCFNIQNALLNDDRDHFICVSGKEGSGKSTLGVQLASVISPNFRLENICFEPSQFIRGIKYSKPGDCFVLDEGNLFLFSRESMSDANRMMVKIFALMRQKNLCVIICVPNFFTLDSYVRDHRVDTLINIKRKGAFYCYVKGAIKIISKEGFKFKNIQGIRVPEGTYFAGGFIKEFPKINDIDSETYRKYKGQQFDGFLDELEAYARKREGDADYISVTDASKMMSVQGDLIRKLIHKGELEAVKMGSKWVVSKDSLVKRQNKPKQCRAHSIESIQESENHEPQRN